MNLPKISIITPSFNQGQYIEQTILSVINQNYPNLEYIIIDGGSTDETVDIIKKYDKNITYWVSEKDNGQSEAINKGLKIATGDIINWLNSDDYFEPNALFKLSKAYIENPDKKVFCFRLSHLLEDKKKLFSKVNNTSNELQCILDPIINQQSTFYNKEVINYLKSVNTQLGYTMDYEWWIRFILKFGTDKIFVSNDEISVYRLHHDSKTVSMSDMFLQDLASVHYSLASKLGNTIFTDYIRKRFKLLPDYEFPDDEIIENNSACVSRMIVYFILKWGKYSFKKPYFDANKALLSNVNFDVYALTEEEKKWLKKIQRDVLFKSWTLLRINRKILFYLKKINDKHA